MNLFIFTASSFVLLALQAQLPTLWWAGGVQLEFLPALVVYGALTLPRWWAIVFALATGFLQDALSAAPFGISALAYGVVAVVLTGMREALDRDLPWVQLGAGAVTSAAASLAACVILRLSIGALFKILVLAALCGVLTPLLFFALDYLKLHGETS